MAGNHPRTKLGDPESVPGTATPEFRKNIKDVKALACPAVKTSNDSQMPVCLLRNNIKLRFSIPDHKKRERGPEC